MQKHNQLQSNRRTSTFVLVQHALGALIEHVTLPRRNSKHYGVWRRKKSALSLLYTPPTIKVEHMPSVHRIACYIELIARRIETTKLHPIISLLFCRRLAVSLDQSVQLKYLFSLVAIPSKRKSNGLVGLAIPAKHWRIQY